MVVKNLEYYLSLNYSMTMQWDNDDKIYFVEFPDLPGCMAHGTTPSSAVKLAQKFKKEWLIDVLASGISISEPKTDDDYSGKFVARLTPALHRRLAEQAAAEGRSLNAHVATLLSERSAALTVEKSVAEMVTNMKQLEAEVVAKVANVANDSLTHVANMVEKAASSTASYYLGLSVTSNKEIQQSYYMTRN